jgi:hypothetical protein
METRAMHHVCVVVKDIEKAIKEASQVGIGPWKLWEIREPGTKAAEFHGEVVKFSARLALADSPNGTLEIIQPVSGKSAYQEFLDKKGEGAHHIAYWVENLGPAVKELVDKGIEVIQSTTYRDCTYYYFDLVDRIGVVLELFTGDLGEPAKIY